MRGPRPPHQHPCSFCGVPVSCSCLHGPAEWRPILRDARLWCEPCDRQYVWPSQPTPPDEEGGWV